MNVNYNLLILFVIRYSRVNVINDVIYERSIYNSVPLFYFLFIGKNESRICRFDTLRKKGRIEP